MPIIQLNNVRFSYVKVFRPEKINGKGEPKYSVTLLIPKTNKDAVARIKKGIEDAITEGLEDKFGGKRPARVNTTLHDGDGLKESGSEYGPECKGCYVMTVTTLADYPPNVFAGKDRHDALQTEIYSGCYGSAIIKVSAYNNSGKRGVTAYLNALLKTRDGEPLAGKATTASDFVDLGDDDFALDDEAPFDDGLDDLL